MERLKSSLFVQTTESSPPEAEIIFRERSEFEDVKLDEGEDRFPPETPKLQERLNSIDDSGSRFESGEPFGGEHPARIPPAEESNSGFLELQNSERRGDERTMTQLEMDAGRQEEILPTEEEVSRFKQNDDVIANGTTSEDATVFQGHSDRGHSDPAVASSERLAKETAKSIGLRTEKSAENHELRLTTLGVPKISEKTDEKELPTSMTTPQEQTTAAADASTAATGGITGILRPLRPETAAAVATASAASGESRAGRTDLKEGGVGGGGEGVTPPEGNDEFTRKKNSGRFVEARRNKDTSSTSLEDDLLLRPLASDVTVNRMTSQTTEILRSAKKKKLTSKQIASSTTAIPDNKNNNDNSNTDDNDNNNDDDSDSNNNNTLTSVGAEMKQTPETDAAPPGGENRTAGTANIELQTTALGKSRRAFRRPAFCSLHHVRGNCRDVMVSWYFDPVSESCLPFNYSGCGGNANRHATLAECQVTCAGRATTEGSGTRKEFPAAGRQQVVLSRPMRYASPDLLPSSVNPQRLALQFFLDGIKRDFLRTTEDLIPSNSPIASPFKENPLDPNGVRVKGHGVVEDEGKPEEPATKQYFEAKELRAEEQGSRATEEAEGGDGNRRKESPNVHKERQREIQRLVGSVPDFRKINSEEHVTTEAGKLPMRNRFEESARRKEFHGVEDIRKYPRPDPVDEEEEEEDILRTPHHHHHRPGRPTEYFGRRPVDRELARRAEERHRWSSGQLRIPNPNPKQRLLQDTRPVPPFGGPRELRNIGWIEQTIILPGLPQTGLHLLPRFLDRNPDQIRFRGGPMPNRRGPGNGGIQDLLPPAAVLLKKKSFVIETYPEMDPHKDAGLSPYRPAGTGPGGVRAVPRQEAPRRLPSQPPASSPDRHALPSEAAVGRFRSSSGVLGPDVDPEKRRPFVESGSDFGRLRRKNDWPRSERHLAGEPSSIPGGRPPFDRFTFFQIFVNRDRRPPPPPPPGRPPVPDHFVPSRQREFDPEATENGAERRRFRYQSAPAALPWRPFSETPGDRMRDSEDRIHDSTMYDKMLSKRPDSVLHSSDDLELPRNSPISPSMEKACRLPLDTKSCRLYRPKWYFNQEKGTCYVFYFGGCTGTGNGFETMEDCLKACKEETSELEHENNGPEVKVEDDEPEVKVKDVGNGSQSGSEDVVVFTSPVYGEEAEEEEEESRNKGQIKVTSNVTNHVVRLVTNAPTSSGEVVEIRSTNGHVVRDSLEKATTATVTAVGETERETGDDVDLTKTFSVQYIAIVTTLGVVGLAIVIMIIVSIARLCKRARRSKREHCIQEVIKTHLYGDLPQGLYSESPTASSSVASSSPSSRVTEKEEKLEHK